MGKMLHFRTEGYIPVRVVDRDLMMNMDAELEIEGDVIYQVADAAQLLERTGYDLTDLPKLEEVLVKNVLLGLNVVTAKLSEEGIAPQKALDGDIDLGPALLEYLNAGLFGSHGIEFTGYRATRIGITEMSSSIIRRQLEAAEKMKQMQEMLSHMTDDVSLKPGAVPPVITGMGAGGGPADAERPVRQGIRWICECGAVNEGRFCQQCGKPRSLDRWICVCGQENTGSFCSACGTGKYEV